jgi:hypothetical protein
MDNALRLVYVVCNGYSKAKRTLVLLSRVLRDVEASLQASDPLLLKKRIIGVKSLLENLEDIQVSRETVSSNALAHLVMLVNLYAARDAVFLAQDAKRDASALTTSVVKTQLRFLV